MTGTDSGVSLSDGWDLSGLTPAELWLAYIAIGGTVGKAQVAAYARGQDHPDSYQHNMIAQAINDHFTDRGGDHPVTSPATPSLP